MVRRGFSVVACLLMLALGGCAGLVVHSDVTTFHTLSAADVGKRFIVLPTKEQEGRVEFRQYARMVAIQIPIHSWLVRRSNSSVRNGEVVLRRSLGVDFITGNSIPR